ncbi:MAG: SIS domain-containing protein, partial [Candidatus Glassbacteria bacterium]|nr:SIS domain-containing protein [Candidatus Glassbacteria bacterium]
MDGLTQYLDYVKQCLEKVVAQERASLDEAAQAMLVRFRSGRVVHIYGPGVHSHIAAEDAFCRKGGLIPVNALLEDGTGAADGMRQAHVREGRPEVADSCLEKYSIGRGDLLIVANAYGFNAVCVQAALRARELGAEVVA